jgi:predicted transcriptional regulator
LYGVTTNPTTSFRLSPELLERVDKYAAQLSAQAGVPVSRAAAVAKLLSAALDAEELRAKRKR